MTLVDAGTGEVMAEPAGVHPAAELFPLMVGDEFDALVADIREHGLVEPVWLYQDPERGTVLLDGRNRRNACDAAGVAVRTRWYRGDSPTEFSISQNMSRRHLTTGQKAAVAHAALPLLRDEARRRKLATLKQYRTSDGADLPTRDQPVTEVLVSHEPPPGGEAIDKQRGQRSRDRAAATAGTSGRAVEQYRRIAEEAPDLAESVRGGSMALDRAERILRDRIAERRKVEEAQRQAEAQPEPTMVDLRHGDFREVLADLVNVDAIITDPPYPAEFLPLLDDLAAWADKVLAPDGVLAVLMGQTHLPEVYRRLEGYRPYRWTCAYLTEGPGYVSHPRRVQSNWKPLLVYGGGPRISDVLRSEGSDAAAKSLHKWGQDYAAFHTLVERLTKPGDVVVDPFMGSGTTLLAAKALGRHAIGCDTDAEHVSTARERVA